MVLTHYVIEANWPQFVGKRRALRLLLGGCGGEQIGHPRTLASYELLRILSLPAVGLQELDHRIGGLGERRFVVEEAVVAFVERD